MPAIHLVIITGMSGAGKTVAVQSLEDLGYFCVDNLPPVLIPKFAEVMEQSGGKVQKAALVVDLRGGEFFSALSGSLADLDRMENIGYEILFLDSDDQALVRRYKETRRRHPLGGEGSPVESIAAERKGLLAIKERADIMIDTTHLKPRELKEKLVERYGSPANLPLVVNVVSFGYKYGIPIDSDLVFDVRFLPNPYYEPELRPLSGRDEAVYNFVMEKPETAELLQRLGDFLLYLVPRYHQEGKSQLVVGIGCTGGKHRSVVLAEWVSRLLAGHDILTRVFHRDIAKDHS